MHFILLTALFLISAITATAQERQVQCRFLGVGGNSEPLPVIAVSAQGAEIKCSLPRFEISPAVTCFAKENVINFLSSTDKKPLATAKIPVGVGSVILIFVQTPTKPEAQGTPPTSRIFVIEDSEKNFPDGGAYVANFYNKDIRFILGEHKGMLHAAGSHGYAMPKDLDAFNMASVVFEFQQNDTWQNAKESALRFIPGMRYLMLVFADPFSGQARVHTYQDVPPPTPALKKP